MRKIAIFVLSAVLALTAGLVVACSDVNLKKSEDKQHTVTYYYNYTGAPSDVYKTEKVDSGTAAKKPAKPTRTDGWTFTEWTTDAAGKVAYNFSIPVVMDLKLYAQWKNAGEERRLTGIEVTGYKAEYEIGEDLGITVKAVYDNGDREPTDKYTVTGYDKTTAGDYHVVVKLNDDETIKQEFDVTVKGAHGEERRLTGIEVTGYKAEYEIGEDLGITVKAVYDNGDREPTDKYTVTGYDKTTAGDYHVVVKLNDDETIKQEFDVTVKAAPVTVTNITATTTKTTYAKGEALDRTSITVTAYYSNGTSNTVSGWTVKGYQPNEVGNQEITIYYEGQPAKLNVTVTEATITQIKVTTKPTKLNYEVYDELDWTGMVVTATLSDNTTNPNFTNYTVDDSEFKSSTPGTYKITIRYQGLEDSFNVTVKMVTYTVEFTVDVDGINEPADQKINKNGLAQKPDENDFQRDGYDFKGWFYKDGDKDVKFDFNTAINKEYKLTAKWEAKEYTVTYHLEGTVDDAAVVAKIDGKTEYSHKYTIEDADYNLVVPTVETDGVHFVDWHKGGASGETLTKIESGSFGDIHVYAEYTKNALVDFFFNHNYGTTPKVDKKNVVSGLKATRPTAPTRTGYTFGDWYEDADCTKLYSFDTVINTDTALEDRTVYASWDPKTIKVTFNPDNGAATFTVDTVYNQTITEPATAPQKLGHKFEGWFRVNTTQDKWIFTNTLEEVLASENKETLTLKAHWTAKDYDVVLKPENGSADITIEDVEFGTLIPTDDVPTDLTKLGHSFDGWFWKDSENKEHAWDFATDKLATEGLTLTAKWKAETYQVKYYNGETEVDSQSVKFGTKVPECSKSVTKTGYHIEGWYQAADFTGSEWVFGDTATLQTEGLNLYVKWEANNITVEFVVDGTVTSTPDAKYDGTVTKPANPTKTGYTFLHWHILDTHTIWVFDGDTDENGAALTASTIQQTSKLTLEAHWEANKYGITYEMGDKATAITDTKFAQYTYGKAFTLPSVDDVNVTAAGWHFEGWYDGPETDENAQKVSVIAAGQMDAKTFYAHYTQNELVEFVYHLNYTGASDHKVSVPQGTAIAYDDRHQPERDHYTFDGWFTDVECKNAYSFGTPIDVKTEVYAKWTPVKYKITFDANGGKFADNALTKEREFTYEETVADYSEKPTLEGYKFKYWYISNENTEYTFGQHPTGPLTLKVKWEKKKYTVTLVYNDGETEDGSIKDVEHGSKIQEPTKPTYPDGSKKFTYWYKDSELKTLWNFDTDTVTSDNVKLYADWETKKYPVEFNVNGGTGSVADQTIEHGGKITKPAEGLVTKTGYHLKTDAEWTLNDGTVWNFATDTVTRAITLKANWEINTYTVQFNSNGGSAVASKTVNHGDPVDKPTDPTKSGFTFAGWTLSTTGGAYNFTSPVEQDLILVANWEGTTGTYLYYTTDGTTWNYGYKAEKNGSGDELVIPRVNITNGMKFRIVTKKDSGSNVVLKAGMDDPLLVKGIFTVAKDGDNFKLTFTNTNYNGSVWTMYVYGLSGVTVAADGSLNKDGTATGVSLVQQHETTKFSPDNKALTSDYLANENAAAANTIYIPGSFTDGFKLNTKWSNAANNGMLVLNDGNTYTFRHVYLQKLYGFKIYLSSDKGWYGGVYTGLDTSIPLSKTDAPDVYLGGEFTNGWYDLVFTNGTTKTLKIVAYQAPTVATVTLITPPTNREYWQGEPFNKAGMAVSYTDTDGNTYPLGEGDYTMTGNTTNAIGVNKVVEVSYGGKKAEFTITVKALTVTFNPVGGTMPDAEKVQNVTYNSVATRPTDPTKAHYDLDENWYTDADCTIPYVFGANGTKVTAPITLYAKWTLHKYDVTFSADGSVIKTVPVTYNTTILAADIPDASKVGHTYVWTRGGSEFDFDTPVTENLQLIASYTPNKYTVEFVYYNKTEKTENVNYGSTLTAPGTNKTDRTGYTFDGWFWNNGTGNVQWTFGSEGDQVTGLLTLTGKWTAVSYTITYNYTGYEVDDQTVVATLSGQVTSYTIESEKITLVRPTVTSPASVKFIDWHLGSQDGEVIKEIAKGRTGDIQLYAEYDEKDAVVFSFHLCDDDNTVNETNVVPGKKATEPAQPSRTGWHFEGWYTAPEGDENAALYDFDATVTAATDVYAHWTINKYNVTFNSIGGSAVEGYTDIAYGSTISKPADPSRTGDSFGGWYKESTYKNAWNFDEDTMPDNDLILYAKWNSLKFTVTFMNGTETAKTMTDVAYNAVINDSDKPTVTKAGFRLKGWTWDNDGTTEDWVFGSTGNKVTSDVTLTARWVALYTVQFNVNGGSGTIADLPNVEAGSKIDPPTTSVGTRNGYTFSTKWYKEAACTTEWDFAEDTVTEDITLYAGWTIIEYKVEYRINGTASSVNGGNPAKYKVTDGTDGTVALKYPTPDEGYDFDGWYQDEDYSDKVENLTFDLFSGATAETAVPLYGRYVKKTYTVTFKDGSTTLKTLPDVEHGSTIAAADAPTPTKAGYELIGWKNGNATWNFADDTVTGPLTLTADWRAVAAKVNGIYNGNTPVKAFVWETKKENIEYAAKYFKVASASDTAPFNLKIWVDNKVVSKHTNLKNQKNATEAAKYPWVSATGEGTENHVISIKAPGIYTLYYQFNGDDNGIWVAKVSDNPNEYVEPSSDMGGVYVGGTCVAPFVVNNGTMNQVMAKNVEITDADDEAVDVTFQYGGAAAAITAVVVASGITNAGTSPAVKLYSGTYSFYFNYATNSYENGETQGRMYISGTQTGGPVSEYDYGDESDGTIAIYIKGSGINNWTHGKADQWKVKYDSAQKGYIFTLNITGSVQFGFEVTSDNDKFINTSYFGNATNNVNDRFKLISNDADLKCTTNGTYKIVIAYISKKYVLNIFEVDPEPEPEVDPIDPNKEINLAANSAVFKFNDKTIVIKLGYFPTWGKSGTAYVKYNNQEYALNGTSTHTISANLADVSIRVGFKEGTAAKETIEISGSTLKANLVNIITNSKGSQDEFDWDGNYWKYNLTTEAVTYKN